MSLVVFPFKDEPAALIAHNVDAALSHDRVDEVWAVASPAGMPSGLEHAIRDMSTRHSKAVRLLEQERIGSLRPGKGDAINTALRRAATEGRRRVHFYDADITNFDGGWIEGAENAADRGFGVVRHRFPRAATDAMITWFITRPALAMLFPGTVLPRLNQPLGGEFLVTASAISTLASSTTVMERSDWGIDTLITYETSVMDLGLYEHHVDDGKRHSLYGSLAELEDMAVECLDAVASLGGRPAPPAKSRHGADSPGPVPADLKETVGYDASSTASLLQRPLSDGARGLARGLPAPMAALAEDEDLWGATLHHLLVGFDLPDPAWRQLAFHLWASRVVAYTRDVVPGGYDAAIQYLEETIRRYEEVG